MNKKVRVEFEYDEELRKWEVWVHNVTSQLEALQAFGAVVLTARDAKPMVEFNKAIPTENNGIIIYKISVGV